MFALTRQTQARPPYCALLVWSAAVLAAQLAWAQSPRENLQEYQARAGREGWTYTVGETSASSRPIEQLCGLVPPPNWQALGERDDNPPRLGLPASYDWRTQTGCPPIRDQGNCGSCWAFSTVGTLECNILIHDGTTVDLSEQWLVSCNRDGWSCDGGWWAFNYFQSKTDSCGGTGPLLESVLPYTQTTGTCRCPYAHTAYRIDGWAYVGSDSGIAATSAIKQALMDYGPVSSGICADGPFMYYTGGVYNTPAYGTVNHAVVIVGWDDNAGGGAWIVRNSWGTGWGESGYFRIAYGCASIGYSACYVRYSGQGGGQGRLEVTPTTHDFGQVALSQTGSRTFTLKNTGSATVAGSATGLSAPFSFQGTTTYSLDPNQTATFTVRFSPTVNGDYDGTIHFSGANGATATVSGVGGSGDPNNPCNSALTASEGANTGSTVGLTDSLVVSCGEIDALQWYRYVAPSTGRVTVNTCGSTFDTVISVHSTCGGAELACSDDDGWCASSLYVSSLAFDAVAGQTYYLCIGGFQWQTGNYALNIASATPVPTYTLAGRVLDGSTGLAGVTLTGLPGSPTTDANGMYTVIVTQGFSATVTPVKTGFVFDPPNRTYNNMQGPRLNQNYTALDEASTKGSVQVTLLPAEAAGAGARWQLDGGSFYSSGQTVGSITPGGHVVSYAAVDGWNAPATEYVSIVAGQTTALQRAYLRSGGTLFASVTPWYGGAVIANPLPDHSGSYAAGTVVLLTAVPLWGYHITTWEGADSVPATGSTTNTVTMNGNRTVSVNFEADPVQRYPLTVRVGSGTGSITPLSGNYLVGEKVTLTAKPAAGYEVVGWDSTDDDTVAANTNTVTMAGPTVALVYFAAIQDCNGNGISDRLDIANGTSADCDGNGVPDECQPDSDGDGIIDACDPTDNRTVVSDLPPVLPASGAMCGAGIVQAVALSMLGMVGMAGVRRRR